MDEALPTIGILGAGKLGVTLGQLARRAGYPVYITGSGEASKIALTVEILVPGAVATSAQEAASNSDIIILALPLGKFKSIPRDSLKGKLVIDAMNHWWEVDGPRESHIPDDQSSSEAVQKHLVGARVVKALNHMGYHHLHDEAKPAGAQNRKAIAIAGDNSADVEQIKQLVNRLGFDPLVIGRLAEGRRLEAGERAFGANVTRPELEELVSSQPTHADI